MVKTVQKITERFYWKTIWSDVIDYIKHCDVCQRTNDVKVQKATAPLHPIPVKSKVWKQVNYFNISENIIIMLIISFPFQIGIDLVGPLPETARGNRYIITLVDYFSKWPALEEKWNFL